MFAITFALIFMHICKHKLIFVYTYLHEHRYECEYNISDKQNAAINLIKKNFLRIYIFFCAELSHSCLQMVQNYNQHNIIIIYLQ